MSKWKLAIFFLQLMVAVVRNACPYKCHCENDVVICKDAGLTDIPKHIALSTRYIDLSRNPLPQIKRDFFLMYGKLKTLLLNRCGQKSPIDLPPSLKKFEFDNNLVNLSGLIQMLRTPLLSLEALSLKENQFMVKSLLPMLPKGIKILDLSGNILTSLDTNDLNCCIKLMHFACASCGMRRINSRALDRVTQLYTLLLPNNELAALPDDLFKYNARLRQLDLYNNKLVTFHSSKVGLNSSLNFIDLGYNEIKSFNLRSLKASSIGLANNKITELEDFSFRSMKVAFQVFLQCNQITRISQTAFSNLKFVSELVIFNNSIKSLPKYLFRRMAINKILLHGNQFTNFSGVLKGMKRAPSLLTLDFSKTGGFFDVNDFSSMSKGSKIYITCNSLRRIRIGSKLKASVKCIPSTSITFHLQAYFALSGYECHYSGLLYHCQACPVGFYSDGDVRNRVKGHCIACPSGSFYQDEIASLSCKTCPLGQFVAPERSPGKDPTDCTTCPQGTNTSYLAGTRACRCLNGYSRVYRFGACKRCRQKGYVCRRDYPQLDKGYWMTWNGTVSGNTSCKDDFQAFISNLENYNTDYDEKTMQYKCQLPIPVKCPISDSCNGGIDASCSIEYTGALCAVCSQGYHRQFDRCIKCPNIEVVILEILAYVALFILLCLIVSWADKVTAGSEGSSTQRVEKCQRTLADSVISSIKIMIGFYQILLSILHAFRHVNWPVTLSKAVSVMDYIQFQMIRIPSFRCIKANWNINLITEFWFLLFSTLTVPLLSLCVFLIRSCYIYGNELNILEFRRKRYLCGRNCIRFTALFLFTTYSLTSTKIAQVLPVSCHSFCTAEDKGVCLQVLSYLHSDYSIPCPSITEYKYTLIAAYSCLVIPLGLPIILLILLWHHSLKEPSHTTWLSDNIYIHPSDTIRFVGSEEVEEDTYSSFTATDCQSLYHVNVFDSALRFTYENYKESCWYWESIELIRKLIMTVGVTVFLNRSRVGQSIITILAIWFALLHAAKKPIQDRFENFVQLLSLFIVAMNLSLVAVCSSNIAQDNSIINGALDSRITGILLVTINSLVFVLFIGRFIKLLLCKLIRSSSKRKSQ